MSDASDKDQPSRECVAPLDEETLALAALAKEMPAHARSCEDCRARYVAAVAVLTVDGFEAPAAGADRRAYLVPLLEAALEADRYPARLHVTLASQRSEMTVRGEGLDFRYRDPARPALRRDESPLDAPLTFRRRFAELDLRFQLVAEERGFRLVLEVSGEVPGRTEAALLRDGRVWFSEPVAAAPIVFRRLPVGRYELVIRRGGVVIARTELEVEPDPNEDSP